jgi:putative thiol protease/hemagglutinin prtT
MFKSTIVLALAAAAFSMGATTAQADPVDRRQAAAVARHYLSHPVPIAAPAVRGAVDGEAPAYHLFVGKDEQRFVIVSGESRLNEVVGYGRLTTGNAASLPPQVHALLQQYTETVRQVRAGQAPAATAPKNLRRYVEPLIDAQWGQSYPYNSKTPRVGGKPTYTGCVATAAAQFLYFYKWPLQRPPLYVRSEGDEADTSPTYLWDLMKSTREQMNSTRAAAAVGRLLLDVGKAIRITFGTQASPSNIEYTLDALQNDFGYTTRLLHRDRMKADEFREAIMQEISDGYPVMMCGGVHAFVYDGYDRRGFVHANFGWDGQGDGYYDINTITTPLPGPFMGNGQFWENQVALMAHPKNGKYPDFPTPLRVLGARKNTAFEFEPREGQRTTRFAAKITAGSYNSINGEFGRFSGQVGFAVNDAEGRTVKLVPFRYDNTLWSSIFTTWNLEMSDIDLSDVPDGHYLLVPVCRELVARKPDTFKPWYPIRYGNRMKLSVADGKLTVEDEIAGGALSVCRDPELLFPAYAGSGDPALLTFTVRNPNVDEMHGNLKMTFTPVNGGAEYVAPFRPSSIVSFRRLADTQVAVDFPTNYSDNTGNHEMKPGRYKLKLVLETTNTKEKQLIPLGADRDFEIEVLPYPDLRIFVRNVDYLIGGKEVNQQIFDVDKDRDLSMRIHTEVRGDQRKAYWGRVFYRLVCPETGESVDAGVARNVSLQPFVHNPEQKTAAKIDVSRLKPGCRYEVHVEIEQGNGRREIWTNDSPRAQLMVVKNDDTPTPDQPVQPVVPPTPAEPVVPNVPKAAQVVLDSTQIKVHVDDIFNLAAKVLPATAAQQLTWQLSEPGIVDMLGGGSFKALQKGEVTITALALDGSGAKAECRVTVVVPTALSTQSASTRPYVEWSGSHLLLCGVQRGVRVRLCTLEGRTLRSVVATGAPLRFEFGPMRGLFLLETSDGFREKIVR